MDIRPTGCCGVLELTYISTHNTPQEVVKDLCRRLWQRPILKNSYGFPDFQELPAKPYGHYIFTGVVRYTNKNAGNTAYAPRLAEYIRANRLGTVSESEEAPNRVNHPGHWIKVYVWQPNPLILRAWWEANGGQKKVRKPRVKRHGA